MPTGSRAVARARTVTPRMHGRVLVVATARPRCEGAPASPQRAPLRTCRRI